MAESRRSTSARRERILDLLQAGDTQVDSLSVRLGLSASTIRRDLAHLRRDGRVARTYGGALPAGRLLEVTLEERRNLAIEQKDAIARRATSYINKGDSIILDAGTTTGRLAHLLRASPGLTIATNGMTAANELAGAEGIDLVLLGGTLRRASQGMVGPIPEQALRRMTVDTVFLGASGLDAQRGICQPDFSQTSVKEAMAMAARQVIVIADSSKLGDARYDSWMPLVPPWTLVTDSSATPEQLDAFRKLPGVTVDVASLIGDAPFIEG